MTAKPTIHFELARDVPTIIQHVLARQLQVQAFEGARACLYAGPCAIGCLIPTEYRASFDTSDDDVGFETVHQFGLFTTEGPFEYEMLKLLQELHDSLATKRNNLYQLRFMFDNSKVLPEMHQRGIEAEILACHKARREFFAHLRELNDRYGTPGPVRASGRGVKAEELA